MIEAVGRHAVKGIRGDSRGALPIHGIKLYDATIQMISHVLDFPGGQCRVDRGIDPGVTLSPTDPSDYPLLSQEFDFLDIRRRSIVWTPLT